ncbi:hypothetical protein PAPYR_8148 [Paratrimastix pyriformis]|uniref:Uncharacterized protein n=1 Tax=Paratrimastix pyriformis TaxID=342808 RepID=A0ABQ8UBA6_9EUKA|nr:hypothetical protein PAPYR_8148 [Paratrimastix pyriformis]
MLGVTADAGVQWHRKMASALHALTAAPSKFLNLEALDQIERGLAITYGGGIYLAHGDPFADLSPFTIPEIERLIERLAA